MLLQKLSFGAFRYFLLQAAGIGIENIAAYMFGLKTSRTKLPLRLLGYIWVLMWSVYTLPLIVDPNIEAGMFGVKSQGLDEFLEYIGYGN